MDPDEEFSAGDFHDHAHAAVQSILARGRLPIVVGGTGFYISMLIFGKSKGGRASAEEAAEALRLIESQKAKQAAAEGVRVEDLEAAAAWKAGLQLLRDLGDSEGAERCGCLLFAPKAIMYLGFMIKSSPLRSQQTAGRTSQ